jgi:adenylate kinase
MNLILLGAPGAGKGTQGALLEERLGMSRIATGDLLREAVRQGTSLGQKAKRFMDAGELVPDDVILGLVREAAARGQSVFDGFPRTTVQAEALDRILAEEARQIDAVVVVDVPDEILVRRIAGRRGCATCGAVYNVYFQPPRREGVCDRCGGALTQRADDTEETVQRRLQVYREQTEPLIDYYRGRGRPVHTIDGTGPVEEVFASVAAAIGASPNGEAR